MSTIPNVASSPAHLPPTSGGIYDIPGVSSSHPVDAAGASAAAPDITSQNNNTPADNHLMQAVQQALNHLSPQSHAEAAPSDTSGSNLPASMQSFIQALLSSLHQVSATQLAQQHSNPTSIAGAVGATGSRYTPGAAVSDVRNLMQQASAVLSSNAVLQQDFQTMMRAAGVHETPSLDRFLHAVSSRMGGQSSIISAIA